MTSSDRAARTVARTLLRRLRHGRLTIVEESGRETFGNSDGLEATLRVIQPSLWRTALRGGGVGFAEAYMDGLWDSDDVVSVLTCSRVHNRCGTNLVFLLAIAGVVLQALPTIVQIPLFLLALAAAVELMSVAARRPKSAPRLAGWALLRSSWRPRVNSACTRGNTNPSPRLILSRDSSRPIEYVGPA